MQDALILHLVPIVKEQFNASLQQQPVSQVASIDWVEAAVREVAQSLAQSMLEAWTRALEQVALDVGSSCPECRRPRVCAVATRAPS